MSQENVELIRRGIVRWNRAFALSDEVMARAALDEMVADYHPDAALDYSRTLPDFEPARGREAMIAWATSAREFLANIQIEPLDFIDAGDAVVVPVRMRARGARSGIDLLGGFVYVFQFQGRLIASATSYRELNDALEAVGLSKDGFRRVSDYLDRA